MPEQKLGIWRFLDTYLALDHVNLSADLLHTFSEILIAGLVCPTEQLLHTTLFTNTSNSLHGQKTCFSFHLRRTILGFQCPFLTNNNFFLTVKNVLINPNPFYLTIESFVQWKDVKGSSWNHQYQRRTFIFKSESHTHKSEPNTNPRKNRTQLQFECVTSQTEGEELLSHKTRQQATERTIHHWYIRGFLLLHLKTSEFDSERVKDSHGRGSHNKNTSTNNKNKHVTHSTAPTIKISIYTLNNGTDSRFTKQQDWFTHIRARVYLQRFDPENH